MTVGVIGAKGGVGTTTLALNAAAALVMGGENPVVADFRLGAGSMGLMLGIDHAAGMANVLSKAATEIQPTLIEKEILTHSSTLRALLSSTKPQEAQIKYAVETAVAVVDNLRTLGRPAIFDLGSGYSATLSRLQLEMDQIILVVDPYHITLAMARELIQELESASTTSNRIHIVVVNRSPFNVPWNEVENFIGRELRAIISDAPELVYQATRAATPMVMLQPNAIVSNQIVKLTEDLNTRIRTMAGSQLMT
jgi:pilus assembly protein CpaE